MISSTNYQTKEVNEIETGNDGIAYVDVALDVKAKQAMKWLYVPHLQKKKV